MPARSGTDLSTKSSQSRSTQLVERIGPSGHGHQRGFARALDVFAASTRPVHVSGGQSDAAQVPEPLHRRGGVSEVECVKQALGRDRAGQVQGPADVLLVDEAVGDRDGTTEA